MLNNASHTLGSRDQPDDGRTEAVYEAKSSELKIETSSADESLAKVAGSGPDRGPRALSARVGQSALNSLVLD